ncbi:hypothetical protein Tco_0351998 [Tanacetum coccineum]
MHDRQNDPIAKEKKVNIAPIDYVALNKLSKHFVPQKQLSTEHAFWLPISKPVSEILPVQLEPVLKEIPRELPTISLVKDGINKMRSHVNDFENAVTVCTKVTGQNEGLWGFEHIQKAFEKYVKPFVNILKEYFHMFDQGLHKEITDMKKVFTQMETKVAKCSVERKTFEIKEKELIIENDRLLEYIICQDVMSVVMHADVESKNVLPTNTNSLEHDNLEVDLLKKENDRLLELIISQDLNVPEFLKLFEINDLKAQLEAKNKSISKLKDYIATLKGKSVSAGDKFENLSKLIEPGMYRNDHIAAIRGYGDYHIGNVMISQVYYVEGLGHNLFLVGQFCDSDLEVAFHKHACYVRDLEGVDLIKGSRGLNLSEDERAETMDWLPVTEIAEPDIGDLEHESLWSKRMVDASPHTTSDSGVWAPNEPWVDSTSSHQWISTATATQKMRVKTRAGRHSGGSGSADCEVQALQAAVQQRDVQIQQPQTMVSDMSSRESTLMQCILGMERRLADLGRRPPGP